MYSPLPNSPVSFVKTYKISKEEEIIFKNTINKIETDCISEIHLSNIVGIEEIKILSEALQKNKSCTLLDLKQNKFGNEGCKYLSEALKNNSSITELNLQFNQIESSGFQFLAVTLPTCSNLKILNLDHNRLKSAGAKVLAELLKINISIEELRLSGNEIRNSGITLLAQALSMNYILQKFYFLDNPINSKIFELFANALMHHPSLILIDLSDSEMSDSNCVKLCSSLEFNFILQYLSLESCKFESNGIKFIQNLLNKNKSIQSLRLNDKSIVEDLLTKNRLKSMIINSNSDLDWKKISEKQRSLEFLSIRNNWSLKSLPDKIAKIRNITILDLYNCGLTEFPDLKALTCLICVNLTKNQIEFPFRNTKFSFDSFSQICSYHWNLHHSVTDLYLLGNKNINLDLQRMVLYFFASYKEYNEVSNILKSFAQILLYIGFSNNTKISNLSELSKSLKKKSTLDLSGLALGSIQIPFSKIPPLENLSNLILKDNKLGQMPSYLMNSLQMLNMENNSITFISDELSRLQNLNELILNNNPIESIPKFLSSLSTLQVLSISSAKISTIDEFTFVNLKELYLSSNQLSKLSSIINWQMLQILDLKDNKINILEPEINKLLNLRILCLDQNEIKTLPEEIGDLVKLEGLSIVNNNLTEIPIRIGELTKLTLLNFSQNKIKKLPLSLAHLNKITNFDITGNPLESPPIQISNNWETLKNYLLDSLIGQQECNFVKMIILGEENVGKTTLIRGLKAYTSGNLLQSVNVKKAFKDVPLSTDGLEIFTHALKVKVDAKYKFPDNKLIFNIWDFGGQQVYYSTHAFFLSEKSLFVIVFNLSRFSKGKERVAHWYTTITSLIPDASIIFVGTHLDDANQLCLDIDEIKSELFKFADENISEQMFIPVDCSTGQNFNQLLQALTNMGLSLGAGKFPKMYLELKAKLDQEAKTNPICKFQALIPVAKTCNIVGEKELVRALVFLHYLGYCLYFQNDPTLNAFVVINPQWLANAIATLVSTKSKFIEQPGGILDHKHLRTVWKEYSTDTHETLFELMQKFCVAIPISNLGTNIYEGKSLVPAFLSSEEPLTIDQTWISYPIKLRRIYKFSYIPSDLFSRWIGTMVLLWGLKITECWKGGMKIVSEIGACALICISLVEKCISMAFGGENWFPLFHKIKYTFDMLLKKWDTLESNIFVSCPDCLQLSTWDFCFSWKSCLEHSSEENQFFCERSKKKFNIDEMIPELAKLEIKIFQSHDITLHKIVGTGSFSQVFQAYLEDKIVAVKVMTSAQTEEGFRDFIQEMQLLTNESHPNLVQIIGVVISPPWLIMPYAPYGSLFNSFENKSIEWKWPLPLRVMYDVSLGMKYLHNLKPPILHCDLRSPNVLLFSLNYREQVVAKVCDFGLAQYSLGRILLKDKSKINVNWAAPEVIQGKDVSPPSDVFSFGMVMYECLTRQVPFSVNYNPSWKFRYAVEDAICSGILPPYDQDELNQKYGLQISNRLYQMFQACCKQDPNLRPSFVVISSTLKSLFRTYISSKSQKNLSDYIYCFDEFPQLIEKHIIQNSPPYTISKLCSIQNWKSGDFFVKQISLSDTNLSILDSFLTELQILRQIKRHPNLHIIEGYYFDSTKIVFFSHYNTHGSLASLIETRFNEANFFSLKELIQFVSDILNGLNCLHKLNVSHKNIKPNNILVKLSRNNEVECLTLSDFGSSALYHYWTPQPPTEFITFVAPECFDKSPELINFFFVDIWSFGITLFEMVIGIKYGYLNDIHTIWISRGTSRPGLLEFKGMFFKCINSEPTQRPTTQILLSDLEKIKQL